jgi:putative transposase
MLIENKSLSQMFWGRHLWGRGYFVATSGNITDEVIMDYINNQEDIENAEDFSIAQS